LKVFLRIVLAFLICFGLLVGGFFFWFYTGIGLPKLETMKDLQRAQTSKLFAADGSVIAELHGEQNRENVPLDQIGQQLQDAVIAIEDERFYHHNGVDWYGIARAFWINVVKGGVVQGGSTITQQYVKNTLAESQRTYWRKLEEANLAFQLEKKYSKQQILEMYLNDVYFGQGCYGVKTACQIFFNKAPNDLTLGECALLAGIIRSPNGYSPYFASKKAKERRDVVLNKMVQLNYISEAQAEQAKQEPIAVQPIPEKAPNPVAPYFTEYVTQYLKQQFGDDAVFRGGLRIYTTVDLNVQAIAEEAIANTLDEPGDPTASMVVLDPRTGQIKAMVGGQDFTASQYNIAAQGGRQPGSAFKVFVLAAALSIGISPSKMYDSSNTTLDFPDGTKWKVQNNEGASYGEVSLEEGTIRSINVVYAHLIKDVGVQRVVSMAHDMGITSPINANPAIAIGGLEHGVNPLEMASAFGTLANNGVHCDPIAVTKVTDADGNVLLENSVTSKQVLRPEVANMENKLLQEVVSSGTGTSAQIGRPQAGKTGSTDNNTDAWFCGYTPDLVAAVWVGYPEGLVPMRSVHGITVYGGTFPARIWRRVMNRALEGVDPTPFPAATDTGDTSDEQTVSICPESGLLATQYCPHPETRTMPTSEVPTQHCNIHTYDTSTFLVPSVGGMTAASATRVLSAQGFAVQEHHVASSSATPGTVTDQSPAGGTRARQGSTVTITVSDGPARSSRVPSVVGMAEADAINTLMGAGFSAKVYYTPSSADKVGIVISQYPGGGSNASPGAEVLITVGKASTP